MLGSMGKHCHLRLHFKMLEIQCEAYDLKFKKKKGWDLLPCFLGVHFEWPLVSNSELSLCHPKLEADKGLGQNNASSL